MRFTICSSTWVSVTDGDLLTWMPPVFFRVSVMFGGPRFSRMPTESSSRVRICASLRT